MKKNMTKGMIVLAVVLIVYNALVFLIPFEKTAVFWFSYLFTMLALAVTSLSLYIAFVRNPDARSRFYGFPVARIGVYYAEFQLIAGFVGMALGWLIPVWIAVLVYVVALGAAVIGLIAADTVAEEIGAQDQKLKKDVILMRGLQSKVNQMISQCDDADALKAVRELAEDFRYSDPVSSEAMAEIEKDLSAMVEELQLAVVEGNAAVICQICRKTSVVLSERNRLCKLNKQQ